jgi:hypothetical protein
MAFSSAGWVLAESEEQALTNIVESITVSEQVKRREGFMVFILVCVTEMQP